AINLVISHFSRLVKLTPGTKSPLCTILHDFTSFLQAELLLVLGCPGSSCSMFLWAVMNQCRGFVEVLRDVTYTGFSENDIAFKYRGEVVYNGEDDVHFLVLMVKQTWQFALKTKVKHQYYIPL